MKDWERNGNIEVIGVIEIEGEKNGGDYISSNKINFPERIMIERPIDFCSEPWWSNRDHIYCLILNNSKNGQYTVY